MLDLCRRCVPFIPGKGIPVKRFWIAVLTVLLLTAACSCPPALTAGSGDSALQIPAGVTVTLDLNGYTLNRNRSSGDGLGHILLVHEGATLTLKDSRGSGIYSNGTMEISGGGTIGSNTGDDAGGIFNDTRGTLSISGVKITGNTSKLHGSDGDFSGTITGGTVEAYGALPAYRSRLGTHQ